jgi:hypothetical protein
MASVLAALVAGDPVAGMWSHTGGPVATWVVTPVGDGVCRIEETIPDADGCEGDMVNTDSDATVVGDVLMIDWVTTACPGDPSRIGVVYEGRTVTSQNDGSALHKRPSGPENVFVRTTTEFFDVPIGVFYTDAVTWLASEGITAGTSPTTFSPDDPVTRAQMATFLWRLAGEPPRSYSG